MKFTRHALEQMKRRSITKELVMKALSKPVSRNSDEGLSIFHYIYNENNKRFLLRIFVNETVTPEKIVTVYKTSKINKYHAN